MTGKENWVQKMLNDQRDKLCNNSKVPNQTNQFQTQIMIERATRCWNRSNGQPAVGTNPRIKSSGRKTSRSQEIETRSFHEEAVKHDRTGQLVVETGAPKTRSSDDSKSFNVEETAHDRTEQPVVSQTVPKHVPLMKAQASTLETKQFIIERGSPL